MGGRFLAKNFLVFLAFGLALSSCNKDSGSGSGTATTQDTGVSSYAKASCEFTADQGEAAAYDLPAKDIQETYFAKKFDKNLMKAVMSSSIKETVRFAQMTDVTYYSVQRYKSNSCQTMSFLPASK